MEKLNPVGQLAKYYQSQPIVQALVNAIPICGGSLDTLLNARAEEIAKERTTEFFDELSEGSIELTEEIIQSEDFIHRWVITAKVAVNTRRREKIRLFARLLKSSFLSDTSVTTDEYEEYLSILDELSYREFLVLSTLERYEREFPPSENENELQKANQFWEKFVSEVKQELDLTFDEVQAMLTRLNRTGCYETIVGMYLGYKGGRGKLTATYFRLKKLLDTASNTIT